MIWVLIHSQSTGIDLFEGLASAAPDVGEVFCNDGGVYNVIKRRWSTYESGIETYLSVSVTVEHA